MLFVRLLWSRLSENFVENERDVATPKTRLNSEPILSAML